MKEVKNSITEFEKHKQEYDEERVKEQVSTLVDCSKLVCLSENSFSSKNCSVSFIIIGMSKTK